MFKLSGLIWFHMKLLDLHLYNTNDKAGETLDPLHNMSGGHDRSLTRLIIRNMYVVITSYAFDSIAIIQFQTLISWHTVSGTLCKKIMTYSYDEIVISHTSSSLPDSFQLRPRSFKDFKISETHLAGALLYGSKSSQSYVDWIKTNLRLCNIIAKLISFNQKDADFWGGQLFTKSKYWEYWFATDNRTIWNSWPLISCQVSPSPHHIDP